MVRARGLAVPAADTPCVDLADDPCIRIKTCRCGHTNGNAWGSMVTMTILITMHAWSWEITDFRVREGFTICNLIKLHPRNIAFFVGFITPNRDVVFSGAGDHTGSASRTFININDHPKPISVGLIFFHDLPHLKISCFEMNFYGSRT